MTVSMMIHTSLYLPIISIMPIGLFIGYWYCHHHLHRAMAVPREAQNLAQTDSQASMRSIGDFKFLRFFVSFHPKANFNWAVAFKNLKKNPTDGSWVFRICKVWWRRRSRCDPRITVVGFFDTGRPKSDCQEKLATELEQEKVPEHNRSVVCWPTSRLECFGHWMIQNRMFGCFVDMTCSKNRFGNVLHLGEARRLALPDETSAAWPNGWQVLLQLF